MKFGTLELENNLFLAPMLNITTGPYRRFCNGFHKIGLVFVPMFYTKQLLKDPNSIKHELHKIEEEKPIAIQLIGSDQDALKKSIEYLESYAYDALDINAGCPSRRSIKSREGGYLLKDLKRLQELLKTALKYSSRPVSLKIRIGFDNVDDLDEIAGIIEDLGIEFLTVHARTVKDRFDESALKLDALKKLKEIVSIPIVGNGDITNPIFAKNFIEYTDVDAIMIGRGSIGNPEIFRQIDEFLTKGNKTHVNNNKDLMKKRVKIYEKNINDYVDGISLPFNVNRYKFIELKRNSIWLTKNIKNSTRIRRKISNTKNLDQLRVILHEVWQM